MQKHLKNFEIDQHSFRKATFCTNTQEIFNIEQLIDSESFDDNTKLADYSFITIHVCPNNVFCTLKNASRVSYVPNPVFPNKIKDKTVCDTLYSVSAGTYKIDISKKLLKQKIPYVVSNFLKHIDEENLITKEAVGIQILAPAIFRPQIIKQVYSKFKEKEIDFDIFLPNKKIFNGCRARKGLKKKRQGGALLYKF